jgi:TRAP-type C4-dicarboxylate transport system permease small subunit
MVNKIISVALMVLAFVFFGLTLYAGLRWMTAQGNEEMVTKSKEILKAAIIGLVIVTASYALTKFIFSQLAQ